MYNDERRRVGTRKKASRLCGLVARDVGTSRNAFPRRRVGTRKNLGLWPTTLARREMRSHAGAWERENAGAWEQEKLKIWATVSR
jgi:hypothetical protein